MKVVVIVVAYKGDPWIPKCVESISPSDRHEIILLLVDNYDTPCLADIDAPDLNIKIVKTPSPMGFAEANNYGLVNGGMDSDAVLFLNQDTWSESNWIPACADLLDAEPKLGAVSPTIRQYDNDALDVNFETCLTDEGIDSQTQDTTDVQKAPAVALMVRTSLLKSIGPFDPIFGSYYEDYDLCQRIVRSTGPLQVANQVWVRHFSGSGSTTPEAKQKRMRQIIRNRLIYKLRHQEGSRVRGLFRHFFWDLPRNLLRGCLGTKSSQPVGTTLRATLSIGKIVLRVSSRRRDERAWQNYLHGIGWTK